MATITIAKAMMMMKIIIIIIIIILFYVVVMLLRCFNLNLNPKATPVRVTTEEKI